MDEEDHAENASKADESVAAQDAGSALVEEYKAKTLKYVQSLKAKHATEIGEIKEKTKKKFLEMKGELDAARAKGSKADTALAHAQELESRIGQLEEELKSTSEQLKHVSQENAVQAAAQAAAIERVKQLELQLKKAEEAAHLAESERVAQVERAESLSEQVSTIQSELLEATSATELAKRCASDLEVQLQEVSKQKKALEVEAAKVEPKKSNENDEALQKSNETIRELEGQVSELQEKLENISRAEDKCPSEEQAVPVSTEHNVDELLEKMSTLEYAMENHKEVVSSKEALESTVAELEKTNETLATQLNEKASQAVLREAELQKSLDEAMQRVVQSEQTSAEQIERLEASETLVEQLRNRESSLIEQLEELSSSLEQARNQVQQDVQDEPPTSQQNLTQIDCSHVEDAVSPDEEIARDTVGKRVADLEHKVTLSELESELEEVRKVKLSIEHQLTNAQNTSAIVSNQNLELQAEAQTLRAKISKLEEQLQSAQKAIEGASSRNKELQIDAKTSQTRVSDLESELEQTKAELRALAANFTSKEQQLAQAELQAKRLETMAQEAEAGRKALQDEIEGLGKQLEEQATKAHANAQKADELQDKLSKCQEELDQASSTRQEEEDREKVQKAESRAAAAEAKLKDVEEQAALKQKELTESEEDRVEFRAALERSNSRVEALNQEIVVLQAQAASAEKNFKDELAKMEDTILNSQTAHQNELDALEERQAQFVTIQFDLESSIDSLKQELAAERSESSENRRKYKAYLEQVAHKNQKKTEVLKADLERKHAVALEALRETLQAQIRDTEEKLNACEVEHSKTLAAKNSEIQELKLRFNSSIDATRQEAERIRETGLEMQSELERKLAEADTHKRLRQAAKHETLGLAKQLEEYTGLLRLTESSVRESLLPDVAKVKQAIREVEQNLDATLSFTESQQSSGTALVSASSSEDLDAEAASGDDLESGSGNGESGNPKTLSTRRNSGEGNSRPGLDLNSLQLDQLQHRIRALLQAVARILSKTRQVCDIALEDRSAGAVVARTFRRAVQDCFVNSSRASASTSSSAVPSRPRVARGYQQVSTATGS